MVPQPVYWVGGVRYARLLRCFTLECVTTNKAQTQAQIYEGQTISTWCLHTAHRRSAMIRAFRVGHRLARPARLGTLAREWPGRLVGASARCLRRALALAHTMCRAANYSNQRAAPGRPWHRRLEDSVAQVWSFEERPPVLWLCGAAAESSARKKKEYGSECDSSSSHSCRHLFSSRSC